MKETIEYIINFLLRSETKSSWIGYTDNPNDYAQYKIVITPSSFFHPDIYGTPQSIPTELIHLYDIPVFFGTNTIEHVNGTLVLGADIIASTYYMLSRYEEWLVTGNRDAHRRYIGKYSFAGKHALLSSPIVDEYGQLLRRLLSEQGVKLTNTNDTFSVTLTHDVDLIAQYVHTRGFLRELAQGIKHLSFKRCLNTIAIKSGQYELDPTYTFPWLEQENSRIVANKILFIKATTHGAFFDKPCYNPNSALGRHLIAWGKAHGYSIGLHGSYASSLEPSRYFEECKRLSKANQTPTTLHRQHYLVLHHGEQFRTLEAAGITDDYTMGYADTAGFKLGTCHPVRQINPATKQLTSLILHPLIVMEGSLFDSRYMGLDSYAAKQYAIQLINTVIRHQGELVLLWHNSSVVNKQGPEAKLYHELIDYLRKQNHA